MAGSPCTPVPPVLELTEPFLIFAVLVHPVCEDLEGSCRRGRVHQCREEANFDVQKSLTTFECRKDEARKRAEENGPNCVLRNLRQLRQTEFSHRSMQFVFGSHTFEALFFFITYFLASTMRAVGQGRLQSPVPLLCGITIAACGILPLIPAIAWQSRGSGQNSHLKTCKELPGANDVFVVLKTGATEFDHKFPIHLNTTLQCYPNYMVFSDHHEVYQGQTVHDALEPLGDHMKQHHRFEFELYHRIKEGGRQILSVTELSDRPDTNRHKIPLQSYLNVGWRLDKWKFLPMFQTAYAPFLSLPFLRIEH